MRSHPESDEVTRLPAVDFKHEKGKFMAYSWANGVSIEIKNLTFWRNSR